MERGGFTLVDLVLVLMIAGILAMIVLPQYHSMVLAMRLDAAAGEVVSGLHYAALLAVRHQRPFGFKTVTGENRFLLFDVRYQDDTGVHLDAQPPVNSNGIVWDPTEKTWYVRDFDVLSIFMGVRISATPPDDVIIFYPDGHSAAGNANLMLNCSNHQRSISVEGTTGRVQVQ